MGTWKMPYSLPRLPQAEFEAMRAAYIAKNGYTIYIPGWEDFIHIPIERPITDQEEIHWKAKDWNSFTQERLTELKTIKERRRLQYRRLLGSAQPSILRNRGSILVAIDNNQDALSTLATLARITVPLLPLVFQKLLEGPVGWVMLTADILNLCTRVMTPERSSLRTKRIKDSITENNPFSQKARTKRGIKFWNSKVTSGNIIEALQTSDQMFGYGISLGAIMNLPFDAASGGVRLLGGEKVSLLRPITKHAEWVKSASTAWKSLCLLYTTDGILGLIDHAPMLILAHVVAVAMQAAMPMLDPLHLITEPESYEVEAMYPTRGYLREVIEEEGDNPDKHIGWPVTNTRWASCVEIAEQGRHVASNTFVNYCYENRYKMEGLVMAKVATEAAYYAVTAAAGESIIETDYIAAEKTTHAILNAGYRLPYNLTLPSDYYQNEADFDYNDILPELKNDVDHIFDWPGNKSKIKPEFWIEPNRDFPKGAVRQPDKPDAILDHFLNLNFFPVGMQRSTVYSTYQAYVKFVRETFTRELQQNKDAVHDTAIPGIVEYFNEWDSYGHTPTAPAFVEFLKSKYGINLPKN